MSEADGRWTGIVLSGVARVYLRTEAGRQITIRHPRRGETIGIAALLGESTVSAQAVTACAVMQLDPEHVMQLARTHPALALAIAREAGASCSTRSARSSSGSKVQFASGSRVSY